MYVVAIVKAPMEVAIQADSQVAKTQVAKEVATSMEAS